jgi:uncharacterized membrane protein YjgN (DUF898 family)
MADAMHDHPESTASFPDLPEPAPADAAGDLPTPEPGEAGCTEPPPERLPPAANDDLPLTEALAFTFSGSGKEYFRIWIVNLFLTVATLGIYSAWAKVRRLQYFDRNTHLAGAVFDFRGDPKAILRGRVLAVVMLVAYHYAFGFSRTFGVAVITALLLALPFLLRSALRFRLQNTQYRGLHFGFTGSAGAAYLAYLPPMLTVLLPSVLLVFDPSGISTLAASMLYLLWPLMHGAMKSYQHRHLQFGGAPSSYAVPARRFFKPYLSAAGLFISGLLAMALIGTIIAVLGGSAGPRSYWAGRVLPILSGLGAVYLMYLLIGPYIQVRIANLAWSNTSFPGVEIRSTMSARAFARLQTVNVLLTLLTLGLYRPFAVVRIYRFRLANLTLHTSAGFEQVVADAARNRNGATGDGVADFFGIDLSW